MPGPSSGCFVMIKHVRHYNIVKGGKLPAQVWTLSFVSYCRRLYKCHAGFHKHPCPLLHFSLLAQPECSLLSIAGHRIFLFHCRHCLMLGKMLIVVLLWCWKGLPSGGWWWACWRLGSIPWQCSQCLCQQEIQRHAHVYPLFHWRKPFVLPQFFAKVLPSHFTESKDVPSVPVHFMHCFPEFPRSS